MVAWRLVWLTDAARMRLEQPCTVALHEDEWPALAAVHIRRAMARAGPPNLRTAVRWIARLGRFLVRNGDGEPGVKTRWQGRQRLHDLTTIGHLTHPPLPSQLVGNA